VKEKANPAVKTAPPKTTALLAMPTNPVLIPSPIANRQAATQCDYPRERERERERERGVITLPNNAPSSSLTVPSHNIVVSS
jgi:hypothetical protein